MASELRVNSSTNRSGLGTITYTDSGPIVSGVGTFANGLTVDGTQTTVKSLKLTGDSYNVNWFKTTHKLRFNDNAKATFGTADDISIYHDGSNSYLDNSNGNFEIRSNEFRVKSYSDTEPMIHASKDGTVRLYYDSGIKLATTVGGINVTGTTDTDNLNVAGVTTAAGSIVQTSGHTQLRSFSNPTSGAGLELGYDSANRGVIQTYDRDNSLNRNLYIGGGNVGINQLNPTARLDVSGGIKVSGTLDANGDLDVDGLTNLDNTIVAGVTTFTNSYIDFKPGNGGNAHFRILSTGSGDAGIFFDAANGDIAGSDYVFIGQKNNLDFVINPNANAGNIDFQRAGTTQVRIASDGDVGIGTDNPTDILDINSDSASAVTNMYLRNHANLGGAALNLYTQGTYASPTYRAIIGCSDAGGNIRMGAHSNHELLLLTNNTPRVTVKTSGDVEIADGNLKVAAGHGIDFSATSDANGTMASELFSDYERGTHTYSVTSSSTNPTVNIGNYNKLYYTKIGDMVHVTGELRWTISSHGTGHLRISLPFTSDSTANSNSQGTAQTWNVNWKYGRSDAEYLLSEVLPGANYMIFRVACNDSLNEPYLSCGSNYQKTANSGYGVEYQVSIWYRTG